MSPFPTHHTKAHPSHPTFLLLHGFPSTPLTWSPLTTHLTSCGYGVLTLDLRISGPASLPPSLPNYSLEKISHDVASVIKAHGLTTVIGVGHDWGAALLARLWWFHLECLEALVFMSVPYGEPSVMDVDGMNRVMEEMFGYEVGGYWYFLVGEGAGRVLGAKTPSALSLFYATPSLQKSQLCPRDGLPSFLASNQIAPLPPWLSQEHFSSLVTAFEESGWEHPLMWYKAALEYMGKGAEAEITAAQMVIDRPVVMVAGEEDVVGRVEGVRFAERVGVAKGYLPDVKVECLKGVGHWMMLEVVEETFGILDGVGKRVMGGYRAKEVEGKKEGV